MTELGYYDKVLLSLGWKFHSGSTSEFFHYRLYVKETQFHVFWAEVDTDRPNTMPKFQWM